VFSFDGGQTLVKTFQANEKSPIQAGVYVVRDNCLYLATTTSIISVRSEGERFEAELSLNAETIQTTENALPEVYSSYSASYMKATANGIYFLCGNNYFTWQYEGGGSIIPLIYQSGYMSPGDFQTFEVGRITGTILCTQRLLGAITLTLDYLLPDGTSGQVTDAQIMTTQNAQGYYRFSWNPNVQSYFMGVSLGVQHTSGEQKIDLLEILMYYKPDAEVIPLNEVQA
jgi:hypothetical protein